MANPTCLPATLVTSTGGVANGNADNIPLDQFIRVSYSLTPGGPYINNGLNEPGTNTLDQAASVFAGAAPGTTVYYVLQELAADGVTVLATSTECQFTTALAPGDAFQPAPCTDCGGGTGGVEPVHQDSEQLLLCDLGPDGQILGTAVMVTAYADDTGLPIGPPVPYDPATGAPYVAQGVLQPCPGDAACGAPTQFCFTSTAPVDQPGRMYDTTFTLGQGFAVQGLIKDLVDTPMNVTWEVTDPTATQFVTDLQTAIQSQFPGQTVTVTPGVVDACTGLADFSIHIECLRLDQNPPTLLQLRYNAGRDLIINPAFTSVPPTNQFAYMKRQDAASPVASVDVACTNIANRGWETNDKSNAFETWGPPGSGQNTFEGTTPTPRGTVVQEINAYGSGPTPTTGGSAGNPAYGVNPDTIWQTFTVPAAGNFTIRVVVGGRATTENIPIKLSTGDVNDTGIGDIINTSVNAGKVTNENATPAGPWTTFNQTVPLAAGVYTLAFTGPENQSSTTDDNAFGGLFTDMRVFQDAPNTIENFVNDDVTCTVPTNETSTVCEYWAPRCAGGEIVGWYNIADGEDLTNAQFWGQVPAPICCPSGGDGGSSSTGNLVHTYLVCGTLNGEVRTMSRVVVSDQSGGVIADTFIDTDGAPVTPDTWQPGACPAGSGPETLGAVCYITDPPTGTHTGFLVLNPNGTRTLYSGTGTVVAEGTYSIVICPQITQQSHVLCDAGNANHQFLRWYVDSPVAGQSDQQWDFELDGSTTYAPVGPVGVCDGSSLVLGERCYTIPADPVPGPNNFRGPANSAPNQDFAFGPPFHLKLTNFQGSGVDVTLDAANMAGNPFTAVPGVVLGAGNGNVQITFSQPVSLNAVEFGEMDASGPVSVASGFTSDVVGTTGTLIESAPNTVRGTVNDQASDGDAQFGGVVVSSLGYFLQNGANSYLLDIDFNTTVAGPGGGTGRAAVVRCEGCTGDADLTYIDLATGAVLDPDTTAWIDCPETVPADPVVPGRDVEQEILCDNNGPFLRIYQYGEDTGTPSGAPSDFTLAGAPYVPVGPVVVCPITANITTAQFDVEQQILCDATPTRFLRRYVYDSETPGTITVVNTTLDGTTPFAPVGAVGVCSTPVVSDFDFAEEILCDANGTQFIRRFRFNSQTGVLDTTTNVTLAGAAFVPVGAVSLCTQCCPIEIGQGCYNAGSGKYTALRLPTGVIQLIDSTTGAVILPASIIPCVSDDTVRTLSAQARTLTNATPWTPGGDVVGTLTSLTVTGTGGLWDLVDQNGTALVGLPPGLSLTWSAQDDNTLSGPTSVTPQAGSTVVANWTQR